MGRNVVEFSASSESDGPTRTAGRFNSLKAVLMCLLALHPATAFTPLCPQAHRTGRISAPTIPYWDRRGQGLAGAPRRSSHPIFVDRPDVVDSVDEWNERAKELFPNQPALRIDQLDLLEQTSNPLLADFWRAVRAALEADEEGGSEDLYRVRVVDGELCASDNLDAREQWYLAPYGGDDASGEGADETAGHREERLEGLKSSELPEQRLEEFDSELRVPAELLKAYKVELLNFILRERVELQRILELEKKEEIKTVDIMWEHRVLRRSFDGEFAVQPNLRFHRDRVPDDIEHTILAVFTVVTVLENADPISDQSLEESSLKRAGTVFKLDTQFGVTKRDDPHQIVDQPSEDPQYGDGFLYFHSQSKPGTATIFNNYDDVSDWARAKDESVTVEYSLTPQMAHSVAEVQSQDTSTSDDEENIRSRTILQTKLVFCSSSEALKQDVELIDRLRKVGLGAHLVELQTSAERRFDEDEDGPFSFREFLEIHGDVDRTIARWRAAGPSIVFPFAERDQLQHLHLHT